MMYLMPQSVGASTAGQQVYMVPASSSPHGQQQGAGYQMYPKGSTAPNPVFRGLAQGSDHAAVDFVMDAPRRGRNRAVRVDEDTVAWLKANFDPKHGCSIPRLVVYKAYTAHTESMMMTPANAAGFGKLIRSVFPTVTSRRLGSRGNSRYHYDGLRIKPSSAISMMELATSHDSSRKEEDSGATGESNSSGDEEVASSSRKRPPAATFGGNDAISSGALMMLVHAVDRKLKSPKLEALTVEDVVPPGMDGPEEVSQAALQDFSSMYQQHCDDMMQNVREVNFAQIHANIIMFFTQLAEKHAGLLAFPQVCARIEMWDQRLFDTLLHILVPEVLRPVGGNAHRTILMFAEELQDTVASLPSALPRERYPNLGEFFASKNRATELLIQVMKRRMSLNNMAQAGLRLLQSASQIDQMRQDLHRVDCQSIIRDAAWVTNCPRTFVTQIFEEFSQFLEMPRGLSRASQWLLSIVDRSLDAKGDGEQASKRTKARMLLSHWTYYSTQVLRELTLKSAPSFSSFNILRMLFDEYMYYLVQVRLGHPEKAIVHPEMIVRTETKESSASKGFPFRADKQPTAGGLYPSARPHANASSPHQDAGVSDTSSGSPSPKHAASPPRGL